MPEPGKAVLHGPGEGERHGAGATKILIKATADDTAGSFYLAESVIPPGFPGPPPHVHDHLHDMFYVLEGTLTVRVGDETMELPAGSFAAVPPGTVHTFSNPTGETVRMLNMNTPGGFEGFLLDMTELWRNGPPDQAAVDELTSRYDVVFT